MKLIVGLGNPGKEYENTRHNAGFKVMDLIAQELGVKIDKKKFKGWYTTIHCHNERVILLKPQTFMNLSGESVREVIDFYNIDQKDILVIYDDMDLPVGKIRLREKGSAGGQNGMKNIILHLGTHVFNRIRVGIGKDARIASVDYVLGKVKKDEAVIFNEALVDAKNAAIHSISHDFSLTMSEYNIRTKEE